MKKPRGRPGLVKKARKFVEASKKRSTRRVRFKTKTTVLRAQHLYPREFNNLCNKYGVSKEFRAPLARYLWNSIAYTFKVDIRSYYFAVAELCKARDSKEKGPIYKRITDKTNAFLKREKSKQRISVTFVRGLNLRFGIVPSKRISMVEKIKKTPTYKIPKKIVSLIQREIKMDINSFTEFSKLSKKRTKKLFSFAIQPQCHHHPLVYLLVANLIAIDKKMSFPDIGKYVNETLSKLSDKKITLKLDSQIPTRISNFLGLRTLKQKQWPLGGARVKTSKSEIKKMTEMRIQGIPTEEIANLFGRSKSEVYRRTSARP